MTASRAAGIVRATTLLLALASLAGCGGGGATASSAVTAPLSPMAQVGQQIFSDTALSASGRQSCASCHVADHAFAGADGLSVPLGGPLMNLPGLRATPSLMYAAFTPPFQIAADGTPSGGFFRDGRASTLAEQARQPFLTAFEMANANAAEVQSRLLQRPYLPQFQAVFGAAVLNDPEQTLASIAAALAAYETEAPEFAPFSSKFDAYQDGKAALTPGELKGLALFNDPTKGNCNACHVSTPRNRIRALFTDFTYDNVGLPRNWQIAANQSTPMAASVVSADATYYDLGLCGPQRTDLSSRRSLCGAFKVPTLRNVAVKQRYFHNGIFQSLDEVVSWYVTRDTDPARWYLRQDGGLDLPYNDLPVGDRSNVNRSEVPYLATSGQPTLSSAEITAIVDFLCTLTDGYDAANPAAYRSQPQCLKAAAAATATP